MAAESTYRDAVTDDGCYVLRHVVLYLYSGDNLRPDVYLKNHPYKKYNTIFGSLDQRRTIEGSGQPVNYAIEAGISHFDVSLLALLAEHTCGLSSDDSLLQNVKRVRDWRNKVSHLSPHDRSVNAMNLAEKLQELEKVFSEIIDELDDRTCYNISPLRSEVKRRIRVRMSGIGPAPMSYAASSSRMPGISPATMSYAASSTMASRQNDSKDMPTWGKVLLGTVATAGVLGAAAMLTSDTKKKEEERKNNRNREEECAIM